MSSGDTISLKYLPASILIDQDLDLSEYFSEVSEYGHGILKTGGGRILPGFPPFISLVSIPFYIPFIVAGLDSPVFIHIASKIAVSFFTALSAVYVYRTVCIHTAGKHAFLLALAYGLGTPAFSVASQDMYQHAGALLFLSISIYRLSSSRPVSGGLSLGLAVVMRHSVLVMAPFILLSGIIREEKTLKTLAAFIIPVAFAAAFNLAIYDSPAGAYSRNLDSRYWTPGIGATAGILASPSRGLLIFSPFLAFAFPGAIRAGREKDSSMLLLAASIPAYVFFYGSFHHWWAGHSYGPRLLTELSIPLVILAGYGFKRILKNRLVEHTLILLTIISILAHLIGAYMYDGGWNTGGDAGCDVDECPDRLWSISDSQIIYYLKNPGIRIYNREFTI